MYCELIDKTITKIIAPGRAYNHISFGPMARREDYIEAGLYELKEVYEPITEYQYHGSPIISIDEGLKIVTKTYPAVEKTEEDKYQIALKNWKSDRQQAVDNIEVTYNGIIYQGDEESQSRMSRAILGLPDDVATIDWVAKDNMVYPLTRGDLVAILHDAGSQQTALWTEGRPI